MGFWVEIGTLGWGDSFRWDLKTPCMKNSEYQSQAKKSDSYCNFYNFLLLVPYPNKFVVVCICIVIFHDIARVGNISNFLGPSVLERS